MPIQIHVYREVLEYVFDLKEIHKWALPFSFANISCIYTCLTSKYYGKNLKITAIIKETFTLFLFHLLKPWEILKSNGPCDYLSDENIDLLLP